MSKPIKISFTPDAQLAANLRLYTTYANDKVRKQTKRNLYVSMAVYLGIAGYMIYSDRLWVGAVFAVLGLLMVWGYPKYLQWSFAKNARKFAKALKADQAFHNANVSLTENQVKVWDDQNTHTTTVKHIEMMDTTESYHVIRFSPELTLVIPRKKIFEKEDQAIADLMMKWSEKFETPYRVDQFQEIGM